MNTKFPILKLPESLKKVNLPDMIDVSYRPVVSKINDIEATLIERIRKSPLDKKIKPGSRIAITAGSRGIKDIAKILEITCREVRRLGGNPFLVSAMGSHGGGTVKGEKEILRSLGVTEKTVKAPLIISRETVKIDETPDGCSVYMDREAFKSDGIIVVNRIKPHTDFEDKTESGLIKMLVVGLGKDRGAREVHTFGVKGMKERIRKIGRLILKKAPVILGIALVENSLGETALIEAIEAGEIEEREKKLLKSAKKRSSCLPFKQIDLLIVDEIGKEISGTGLDTNLIGRRMIFGEKEPMYPKITRIAALDLTDESHGNAAGVGLVDVITERFYRKIDFDSFYFNTITSTFIERGKIPVVLPSDEAAIKVALYSAWVGECSKARVVRIKNTLRLENMAVSKSLFEEVRTRKDINPVGKYYKFKFNKKGNLSLRDKSNVRDC